ncbi:3-methyladenine DNA glycosylase AlkD [Nocardioides alpinus]|uniref:3-methyladenine DNA glycosylase AlkD n=1 Tax=Nocardioides alpinus TaxID=748909 RepID=A0A1I1B697_9ACTN|nr:DNA alkylation repair protein [Nocardioides alpinus]PKH41318.1 DNA alkylation repair protein [Nocardioides alpinus]SFB45889.1 3-methyladenine DNA glycosylase AlkD [Nocardioides alpinus]
MTYVGAVRAALAERGDAVRAAQQQAYMKSELPYVGLTAPELRAMLKPLLVEHRFIDRASWEAAVLELWEDVTHREEWYAAVALLRHRAYAAWLDPDLLPLLGTLVRTGAWWDVVDEIASHLVGQVLLDHRRVVTPVMDGWSVDVDSLWIRRTAVLSQLRHREETDTDLLQRALVANLDDTAYGKEFFVRKALGWSLREHAKTDAAWVRAFVSTYADRLSGLSRREALKHL